MSLGGFKFAGYKCIRSSGMSDSDFCLLMHKTRVAAFVDSCAASGAQWHFCKNGGTIDFRTNTGVIYDLDGDGYNFASFFQYANENKYIAILSIPNQSRDYFGGGAIAPSATHQGYNAYSMISMFHCASMEPFEDVQFMQVGPHTYPTKALSLMPITTVFNTSWQEADLNTIYTFFNCSSSYSYFGYATKDSKIITFACNNAFGYFTNGWINTTLIGFDAMTLSSPSDEYNVFHASLSCERQYEIGWSDWSGYTLNRVVQVLNSRGNRFSEQYDPATMSLSYRPQAQTVGGSVVIPYSAVVISGIDENHTSYTRKTGNLLNSDGILSKGVVDIDFLASCVYLNQTELVESGVYANGNYLLARKNTDASGGCQYFVGWDASNPDIKDDSSWPEYSA